jgi:hypothetical protein
MSHLRSILAAGASLLAATAFAQQDAPPSPATAAEAKPRPAASSQARPRAKATPVPVATPLPVEAPRRGFWDRVLGRNRSAAKDDAKPEKAAPKTTPAPRITAKRPAPAAKPAAASDTSSAPPKPAATPRRAAVSRPPASRSAAALDPGDEGTSEAEERAKFAEAKTKALESTALQDLKLKADTATDEDEARRSLRAYNKALFLRMRQIDPSIRERIDATEAFILKRLGE